MTRWFSLDLCSSGERRKAGKCMQCIWACVRRWSFPHTRSYTLHAKDLAHTSPIHKLKHTHTYTHWHSLSHQFNQPCQHSARFHIPPLAQISPLPVRYGPQNFGAPFFMSGKRLRWTPCPLAYVVFPCVLFCTILSLECTPKHTGLTLLGGKQTSIRRERSRMV